MKRYVAFLGSILLVLSVLVASPARDRDEWLPLQEGATWTYAVRGAKSTKAEVRVLAYRTTGVYSLQWDGDAKLARRVAHGVQILEERHVGYAGTPTMMPMAELHWSGPEAWKTRTASGCMMFDIESRRVGNETVSVPAGRYDCFKITDSVGGTWWIARGVGIVKRLSDNGAIEWSLQRFLPGS